MYRDCEKQYLRSIELQPMIDTYLYLAKVYLRLDQPLLAITKLQDGLEKFPYEPCLVQAIARIHEVCFLPQNNNNKKNKFFLFHRVLTI